MEVRTNGSLSGCLGTVARARDVDTRHHVLTPALLRVVLRGPSVAVHVQGKAFAALDVDNGRESSDHVVRAHANVPTWEGRPKGVER